jgi:hypothetical protein
VEYKQNDRMLDSKSENFVESSQDIYIKKPATLYYPQFYQYSVVRKLSPNKTDSFLTALINLDLHFALLDYY